MNAIVERWMQAVLAAPPEIDGDVADENLRWFTASSGERKDLGIDDVASFLGAAADAWRGAVCDRSAGAWVFYAWNDDAAGQLRIGAVQAARVDDLPFRCRIRHADATEIATAFLRGSDHIAWADLEAGCTVDDLPQDIECVLAVWVREI